MTTRYDVERALEASTLPPTARHIALVLCSRMERDSTLIPPRYSPSLTRLAIATGRNRRTIARQLNRLENDGWLIRRRRAGRRNSYAIRIPDFPQPETLDLSTGDTMSRELGAMDPATRGTMSHNQTMPDHEPEIDLVIQELEKRTGKRISPEWAARTRDFILARPGIRNRIEYLRRVLSTDPDPLRFLPTIQPPPFRAPHNTKEKV